MARARFPAKGQGKGQTGTSHALGFAFLVDAGAASVGYLQTRGVGERIRLLGDWVSVGRLLGREGCTR